jgi:hypothetical protein
MHQLHRHGRDKAGHDELDGIDEKTQAALSQIGREAR